MSPLRSETIGRPVAESPIIPLLLPVLDDFHRRNISYCYWKSSRRIHAALGGETDLDLLIAREDQHRAACILLDRGFKPFASVANRDHPALSSFLGYDEPTGRITHFHLHFRLVAGESLLKNYRLPWEEAVLARAIAHPTLPIMTLDPVSEALLLTVRACLDLRQSDPVMLRNRRTVHNKFALDREDLAARIDREVLRDRAAEVFSRDLADMVADAFYSERALWRQRRLRRRIQKELAPYRTYNAVEARARSLGRAVLWMAAGLNARFLHLPRPWNRRAPGGGCVAAMLGVDGSGKTTMVSAMRRWLGSELDVVPIYFGTGAGRPSLLLLPFKLMVPLIAPLVRNKRKQESRGSASGRSSGPLYSALLMVWATIVTLEKRIKLSSARRGASRGLLVLADRYPQNELPDFNDGPLLHTLKQVPHWLRRFEADAYVLARRLPPDLVIKLEATPETLAKREPDMDPTVIRERVEDLRRLTFPGARVVSVDAEQPLPDVIRAVKGEIWRLL